MPLFGLFGKKKQKFEPQSAAKVSFEIDPNKDNDKELAASLADDRYFKMIRQVLANTQSDLTEKELLQLTKSKFKEQLPKRWAAYESQPEGQAVDQQIPNTPFAQIKDITDDLATSAREDKYYKLIRQNVSETHADWSEKEITALAISTFKKQLPKRFAAYYTPVDQPTPSVKNQDTLEPKKKRKYVEPGAKKIIFPEDPDSSLTSENIISSKALNKAQAATITTFARMSPNQLQQIKAAHGDPELFKKMARKLWKEIVVHGISSQEAGKENKVLKFTDLDGKTALYLLAKAGVEFDKVEYVAPGESKPGHINIDTGSELGTVIKDQGRTMFMDHHAKHAGRDTSATKITYETLVEFGLLARQEHLDRMVEFVTQVDNKTFPNQEKYYLDSYRTVLGLEKFVLPEDLEKFFKDGRDPVEILYDQNSPDKNKRDYTLLRKYGFVYKQNNRVFNRSAEKLRKIQESLAALEEIKKKGLVIGSALGPIVIDLGRKIRDGFDTVKHAYNGRVVYLNWSPDKNSFFISSTQQFPKNFSLAQGRSVRGTMWTKGLHDPALLTVGLREVLNKLTDNNLTPEELLNVDLALSEYLASKQPPVEKYDPFAERWKEAAQEYRLAGELVSPAEASRNESNLEKTKQPDILINQESRAAFLKQWEAQYKDDLQSYAGQKVLLKINAVDPTNKDACSASQFVNDLVEIVLKYKPAKIYIGDLPADYYRENKSSQEFLNDLSKLGYQLPLAQLGETKLGDEPLVEFIDLSTLPEKSVDIGGTVFKYYDPSEYKIITTSLPKMHGEFKYSGVGKNLMGFLSPESRQRLIHGPADFLQTNASSLADFIEFWQKKYPALHLLDATNLLSFHEHLGQPVPLNTYIAGQDVRQIDKQMVEILGLDLGKIVYLQELIARSRFNEPKVVKPENFRQDLFPSQLQQATILVNINYDTAGNFAGFSTAKAIKYPAYEAEVLAQASQSLDKIFAIEDDEKRYLALAEQIAKIRVIPNLETLSLLFEMIKRESSVKALSYLFETFTVFRFVLEDFGKKNVELPDKVFDAYLDAIGKFEDVGVMREML